MTSLQKAMSQSGGSPRVGVRGVRSPVHPVSAAVLALADWLTTGLNIATYMDAYWLVAFGCALAGALGVFFAEQKLGEASLRAALIKAALAAALVVLPFPLAGTIVALVFLLWALADRLFARR